MTHLKHIGVASLLATSCAAYASADQWNDRTTITFTDPVMVPGVTLAPGTYTFKLADSLSNRNLVQIVAQDGQKLIATTQAIPIRRAEVTGDVVIKLNPTDAGAPIAIKAWFYPGSRYGHEFIYSDEQARQIAQRTKTLVLSTDVPGSDMEKGTLYNYDAQGTRTTFRGDTETMREWNAQHPPRPGATGASKDGAGTSQSAGHTAATATVAGTRTGQPADSTAPMMHSDSEGAKVTMDDLEARPNQYAGRTINVTAEVDEVFGPRLFKIDEPNWADLDREVLVYMPTALAALVREGDRVTVTGTMKPFVRAEIEKEAGWLWQDPAVNISFKEGPVLVASRIIGGNDNTVLSIDVPEGNAASLSGNASTAASSNESRRGTGDPLTDLSAIAGGGQSLIGRQVNLRNVKVAHRAEAPHKGFWVESGGTRVFVKPSTDGGSANQSQPTRDQMVSIEGVVLQMPRAMRNRMESDSGGSDSRTGAGTSAQPDDTRDGSNQRIYIYAATVR